MQDPGSDPPHIFPPKISSYQDTVLVRLHALMLRAICLFCVVWPHFPGRQNFQTLAFFFIAQYLMSLYYSRCRRAINQNEGTSILFMVQAVERFIIFPSSVFSSKGRYSTGYRGLCSDFIVYLRCDSCIYECTVCSSTFCHDKFVKFLFFINNANC